MGLVAAVAIAVAASAATAVSTATATTAVATTAATGARAAVLTGACLADGEGATAEVGAVEGFDRLRGIVVAHFNEAEATRATGLAIGR